MRHYRLIPHPDPVLQELYEPYGLKGDGPGRGPALLDPCSENGPYSQRWAPRTREQWEDRFEVYCIFDEWCALVETRRSLGLYRSY